MCGSSRLLHFVVFGLERLHEFVCLLLRLIASSTVPLLDLPDELLALAVNHLQVIFL